jgi:hypothetical protein
MNGRLTWWLLGLFASLTVAWTSGLSWSVVTLQSRVSRSEAINEEILRRLDRIETKVDNLGRR